MLILCLIAGLALAAYLAGASQYLKPEVILATHGHIRDWTQTHYLLAIGGMIGVYAITVLLSLPFAAILTLLSGALFGGLTGGLAAIAGASLGAFGLFVLARTVFEDLLKERLAPHLARFSQGFCHDAASYLLFLRLMPVFPFWLVNLAPAMLGVRFSTYAWTTVLGIAPGGLAYAYAGAGLAGVIDAESRRLAACAAANQPCSVMLDGGRVLNRELVIAFVLMAVLALLPVVYRRLRTSEGYAP